MGLEHGRVEVGGGGAGRRHDGAGRAHRGEGGDPFVVADAQVHGVRRAERVGERRAARARAEDDVPDAPHAQRLDREAGEQRGGFTSPC
jgi:hypothetical protein